MSYCITPAYSSVATRRNNGSPNASGNTGTETERFVRPSHDFSETPDAYVLTAQVPGVSKETLETVVTDDQLVITGRKSWKAPEGAVPLIQEIQPHNYRITLRLDRRVDAGKIKAELRHGVLTVTLPKAEAAKPRRIVVD